MNDETLVEVAVEAPLHQTLTYKLPSELTSSVRVGSRVSIPLGRRNARGVIVNLGAELSKPSIPIEKLRPIQGATTDPVIGERTRAWLKWLTQYYLHPPGLVYSLAFAPAGATRKRKSHKTSPTALAEDAIERQAPPIPTLAQQKAIDSVTEALKTQRFECNLLFGVTGSGKTEVYLQSIAHCLSLGRQALVLVPEISLTPQLIKRFVGRFGEKVAVIHSHLTERERADQWWSMVNGDKQILVGARSALFCPLENIGLIIVDEEHEPSFKQEEQLKYNARDAAVMRGHFSNCPVILGSATPSLETWQNMLAGKYKLLELPARVENRPMPTVEAIDLRKEKENRDERIPFWLSRRLKDELTITLNEKQQSALFLNRRGFAQFVLCSDCGFVEQCPNCSVTYTVHGRGTRLLCHYCGGEKPLPEKCPSCKQGQLKPLGLGTEKVAEDLQVLFPTARIARADRDEINTREALESLIDRINRHEIDIIVGTQMIAKGHDFPNLTLVGVVAADLGLHFPDFRASERTFQLLTQVAGRAGRHQIPGRVFVQTYVPEHPAVRLALTHDFRAFADLELTSRKELQYPPFGRLAVIRIDGTDPRKTEHAADQVFTLLGQIQARHENLKHTERLGPVEAALSKLKGRYRFQILVKSPSAKNLGLLLQLLQFKLEDFESAARVSVDIDPLHLL